MNATGRRSVTVSAPAKINLSLGVGPARPDGFHALATVYQAVGLFDRVRVADADDLSVAVHDGARTDLGEVPTDDTNTAARAVRLLAAHTGTARGAAIVIEKGIPVAGGMAGGSADGAAALLACDQLWELGLPADELAHLAAALGSDVPFALVGGTAIGSGRGEVVMPLMTRGEFWWVVLESSQGLSTPAVYRAFDDLHADTEVGEPEIPDALMRALRAHDVAALGAALSNDLQAAALVLRPELGQALEVGREASAHGAVLSGSGPSCLFLCESREHAAEVADRLSARGLGPVSCVPGPVPGARVVARDGWEV